MPSALPVARQPFRPRYDSLDFWRGLACLFVVLHHSVLFYLGSPASQFNPLTTPVLHTFAKLSIGVQLFFVISGYCIAATADKTRLRGSSLKSYFIRRFRRIYPPLWVVMVLSVVFFLAVDVVALPGILSQQPWAQLRPWWYSPWQWVGNITLTETWRHYLIGNQRGHFPGQAWTLCYEEQFYAVVGLLLLAPRMFFRGAVVITALTLAVMWAAVHNGWSIEGFFFDGNWLTFAAGILVYYQINYCTRMHNWMAAAFLVVAALFSPLLSVPGGMVAFAFAVLLLALNRFDRSLASSWLARPIVVCGQMCYSLYLVHQLLVRAVSAGLWRAGLQSGPSTLLVIVPACVAVSVAAAWAFHRLVERKFLNSPTREAAEMPTGTAVVASA